MLYTTNYTLVNGRGSVYLRFLLLEACQRGRNAKSNNALHRHA